MMIFESFKSLFLLLCTLSSILSLIFLICRSDVSIIHSSIWSNALLSWLYSITCLSHICYYLIVLLILSLYQLFSFLLSNTCVCLTDVILDELSSCLFCTVCKSQCDIKINEQKLCWTDSFFLIHNLLVSN